MEEMGDDEWILADLIIGNIDDSGYLRVKFDELIAETKFDREDAFEILKMIQHLDPVGCGAQNLSECLMAQAQVLENRSPLVELVIRDHLEDLKNKDLENISKVTGVALEKIQEAESIIHSFSSETR